MKNRNVHSLCLVPSQDYSPPSLPVSEGILLSECAEHLNFVSASVVHPQTTTHTPSPQKPPADSLSFPLHSKSAIIKAGVITPITPNFSPAACSLLEGGQCQRHLASEPEVNGKQTMPAQSNASFLGDFNTPNSLDEEELSWQENAVPSQVQQQPLSRFERRTYASLSNLPTPPPSDSPVSPVLFPEISGEELRNPDLLGPASYLGSLVPTCASARPASIPLLQLILYRFSLRIEAIALAGIILDSLSSQFVRKWRTELSRLALWDLWGTGMGELLALVALGIAAKWIEDRGVSLTAGGMSDMSDGRFGRREISVTERLMLAELGWGLMELSCEGDVKWALEEMERWRARVGGIEAGEDQRGTIF